jgi:hypothetical protein
MKRNNHCLLVLSTSLLILFQVNSWANCTSPWGTPLVEGETVTAYLQPQGSPGFKCQSEMRVCVNGLLSGSFLFQSCQEDQGCNSPFGYIPNGGAVTAYQFPSAQPGFDCTSEVRVCTNGILGGSFSFSSCVVSQAIGQ